MKQKEIDEFETLHGQFQAFHTEINTLVKKNPSDPLNKFKLGLVNSLLKKANGLLGKKRVPFSDFETFSDEALPSTSDVLVIISQYLSAFEKLRTENIKQHYSSWYWIIDDGEEHSLRTAPPKSLD